MSNWFVLRTISHREFAAETAVQKLGLPAYVPKTVVKRRHPFDRRKVIEVKKSLYCGYVFSPEHFPIEEIRSSNLPVWWYKDGDRIAQINDRLMSQIEAGERVGIAIEEAFETLRMAPITKRLAKRAPYTKDFKAVLGRVAA